MKTKVYTIILDGKKIGTSELEYADPAMGVVHGKVYFSDISSPYDYFKNYCLENSISLALDHPEDKLISTFTLPSLRVTNENGLEITSNGNQITGLDGDEFEITLTGIPYPFYEEKFPHHVQAYNEQFNK